MENPKQSCKLAAEMEEQQEAMLKVENDNQYQRLTIEEEEKGEARWKVQVEVEDLPQRWGNNEKPG